MTKWVAVHAAVTDSRCPRVAIWKWVVLGVSALWIKVFA